MHGLRELEHVEKMKQDLLAKVKALGKELPLNTLDELINHFGGPEHVAEVLLTIKRVFWCHWVTGKGASKAGSCWKRVSSPCKLKKLLRIDFLNGRAVPCRSLPSANSLSPCAVCADDGAEGPGGLQTGRLRHVRVPCRARPLYRPRQPEGEGAFYERGKGESGSS